MYSNASVAHGYIGVSCGRPWLDKCPGLLALALYSYLRVIVDHGGPIFAQLRQREVDFCVSLMRQRVSISANCVALPHSYVSVNSFDINYILK